MRLLVSFLAFVFLLGCQQSGPPIPDAPAHSAAPAPLWLAGDTGLAAGTAPLALFDLTLDRASDAAQVTPLRSAGALADAYTLDATAAFSTALFGCPSCLKVESLRWDNEATGEVAIEFSVTHPFPATDGVIRADLHINNVRLALRAPGADAFTFLDGIEAATHAALVTAPDGYVRIPPEWIADPPGVDTTVHPFVVFQSGDNLTNPTGNFDAATGWSTVLAAPTGFNVLPQGGTNFGTMHLRLPAGVGTRFAGRLALLANFIVSAPTRADRLTPTYFMPEGAMPEAWHVALDPPLGFDDAGAAQEGVLTVRVSDWQTGALVSPSFPDPTHPMELSASSTVAEVHASIPGFSLAPPPVSIPSGGSGTLADPLLFEIPIQKPALAAAGDYLAMVKVRDQRAQQTALQADLETPVALTEIATYQVTTIQVDSVTNQPPTCGGFTTNPDPLTDIPSGTNVELTFDFLNDPDGTIAQVAIDWAFDGTFDPDDGLTGPGTVARVLAADTVIALQFTDNEGGMNDPALCTLPVTVVSTGFGGPVTPFPPAGLYGGGQQSRFEVDNNRPPIVTFDDNVYVYLRDWQSTVDSPETTSYLCRSADGGLTWGTPLALTPDAVAGAGGFLTFTTLAAMANGKLLFAALTSGVGNNVYLSRLANTGDNEVAFDGVIGTIVPGFTDDPGILKFDCSLTTDPTDPSRAYVSARDDLSLGGTALTRIIRVDNADTSSPSFNVISNPWLSPTGFFFDSMMACDSIGDFHIVGNEIGSTVLYREWRKSTNGWRAGHETLPITESLAHLYLAVGFNDDLPVVVYDVPSNNRDAQLLKAANSTAPTFAGQTPMLVSESNTGVQVRPMVSVDHTTGDVWVAYGDSHDAAESSDLRLAGFFAKFDASLNRLQPDLKIDAFDGPGLDDNTDDFGTFAFAISQTGSPSARRFWVMWIDGDATEAPNTPDVLFRIGQ